MRLRRKIAEILPLKKANIIPLALSKFISSHGSNIYEVIWQPYVLSLGGSVAIIGGLGSLKNVIGSYFQILGGRLSDYIGRKTTLVLSYILSIIGLWLCLQTGAWYLLIPAVVLLALSCSFTEAPFQAITAESVAIWERGKAYAFLYLIIFIPAVYISIIGGYSANIFGFFPLWLAILLLEVLAFSVILIFVKETLTDRPKINFYEILSPMKKLIKPPPELRRFFIATVFDRFGWNLWRFTLFGMLMEFYGFNVFQIGVLHAFFFTLMALFQIPAGRIVDKYGRKIFLILSEIILIVALLGLIRSKTFFEFTLLFGLVGIAGAVWLPAFGSYMANITLKGERGRIIGDLNAMRGLISFPAPLIGGALFTLLGFDAPLWVGLFSIVAAVFLLATIEER